ncbi:MAG: sulfatase-like hydrolase/transferase, partial [Planctomycetes bacterium]|nr:sulfatase-like hydrolase/transferase [Planctomycetota bacterium]
MHSRRDFLRALGIGAISLSLGDVSIGAKGAVGRPNIVFIIVDDLGQYDLSCTGSSVFKTPNIDRLAAEGIRFTEAYSGCTVCAPARSTLMTGLHMGHTTVRGNTGGISLRSEDVTIAEVLKKVGYTCGGFGKWGIGDVGTPGVPEENGFDVFFGYYHQVHAHTYYPRYLWRNSEKVPLAGNERPYVEHNLKEFRADKLHTGEQFSHHLILEQAKDFIRENKDGPFFCYCPWTPPHGVYPKVPHEPAMKDFKDKPWPEEAKVY